MAAPRAWKVSGDPGRALGDSPASPPLLLPYPPQSPGFPQSGLFLRGSGSRPSAAPNNRSGLQPCPARRGTRPGQQPFAWEAAPAPPVARRELGIRAGALGWFCAAQS